jgi:hypothetical protein
MWLIMWALLCFFVVSGREVGQTRSSPRSPLIIEPTIGLMGARQSSVTVWRHFGGGTTPCR